MRILQPLLLSSIAGFSVMIGIAIAMCVRFNKQVISFLLSFTVGMILASICFDLMPAQGVEISGLPWLCSCFIGGSIFFMFIDKYLLGKDQQQTSEKVGGVLLLAMMLDDIAEGMVIGVGWLFSPTVGVIMAIVLGLQNIVEGMVEGASELKEGWSKQRIIGCNLLASLTPIVCAVLAATVLHGMSHQHIQLVMAFTAGALLYTTLTDLAPHARMEGNLAENLGAAFGFLLVYVITVVLENTMQ